VSTVIKHNFVVGSKRIVCGRTTFATWDSTSVAPSWEIVSFPTNAFLTGSTPTVTVTPLSSVPRNHVMGTTSDITFSDFIINSFRDEDNPGVNTGFDWMAIGDNYV
jgi:hypothetical protein